MIECVLYRVLECPEQKVYQGSIKFLRNYCLLRQNDRFDWKNPKKAKKRIGKDRIKIRVERYGIIDFKNPRGSKVSFRSKL